MDALLTKIRKSTKEYGIKEKPFVVVKADNADPALAVATGARCQDPLAQRAAMVQALHPMHAVFDVVLQEGVPASERVNDAVAEPVVYHDGSLRGGRFYRVMRARPGPSAIDLASCRWPLPTAPSSPARRQTGASAPNRFYMYGWSAPCLAASYEIGATDPDAERYNDARLAAKGSCCITTLAFVSGCGLASSNAGAK